MLTEKAKNEITNFVLKKFPNAESSQIEFGEFRKLPNSSVLNLDVTEDNREIRLFVKMPKGRSVVGNTIEEYKNFKQLKKLTEQEPFTTLTALGYIESLPALISYRLEGEKLSDRFTSANEELLEEWVSLCGEFLGLYHMNYPLINLSEYEPEDKLYKYFRGKDHLDSIIAGLDKNRFCYRYIDFALSNTFVTNNNKLNFLDPPEWEYPGLIYNDIAKFWNSLYRANIRRSVKTFNFSLELCNKLYRVFLRSYETKTGINLQNIDHYMIDVTKILMIEEYFSVKRFLTGIKNNKSIIERYKTTPVDIPLLIRKKIKVSKMNVDKLT